MSRVDLVILGLLMEEPRHGYDILQQIDKRSMYHWIGVSTPALYRGLARLEGKRMLTAHKESGTNHPDRTVYQITQTGKDHLQRLLVEALTELKPVFFDVVGGIGFAHNVPRDVLLDSLEERREKLRDLLSHIDEAEAEVAATPHFPVTAREIPGFYRGYVEMQIAWLDRLLARVRKIRNWPEGAFTKCKH
ncbi:MAG: helix-turn-helix transcriptional regulator [Candidatus Krumholzibacteriota bacterium]|nr:helix-turn-helix transcriptional regulator [Candidatus Krumholzibacteriota bacterium]